MAGGRIDYTIGFKTDKTGLNQTKAALQEIKILMQKALNDPTSDFGPRIKKSLEGSIADIQKIESALIKAFNPNLGGLNISKFNKEIKDINLTKLQNNMARFGRQGETAFRNLASQALSTNLKLKETNGFLKSMGETMVNTVKWGIASSVMNNFTGSVQKAFRYVNDLDKSLTNIRIVTEKSAEDMEHFAKQANKAAKELGTTTTQYTDAALIYYQQGDSDAVAKAKADVTLKTANVTGQSADEVSEQLTAVWNGYKVDAAEAELYIDKLAAVAATTAADLEELSTGMSKVASAANIMGVDIDQLNAQLATVVSVTRQAPESVGTAFKTIYARMGDIEAGLDTETTLGDYTERMKAMGFNVLDANGKLKDMGAVIEEIGGKWQSLSREQQVSLSQTMAGTRQYNNLLSLFDNWDMYTDAMKTSKDAAGTLQEQQDEHMESTEAHLNALKAATEGMYDSLIETKSLNGLIDILTKATEFADNFVSAIGGLGPLLTSIGSVGVRVFSKQISASIASAIANIGVAKDNLLQFRAAAEIQRKFNLEASREDAQTINLIAMKAEELRYAELLTQEEHDRLEILMKETNEIYNQRDAIKNDFDEAKNFGKKMGIKGAQRPGDFKEDDPIVLENKAKAYDRAASEYEAINEHQYAQSDLISASTKLNNARGSGDDARIADATEEYNKVLQEFLKTAQEVQEQLHATGEGFEDLEREISNLTKVTETGVESADSQRMAEAYTLEITKKLTSAQKQRTNEAKKHAKTLRGHTKAVEENNTALEINQKSFKNMISKAQIQAFAQQTLHAVSAIGQLVSSIQALTNLGEIWSSEDLSAGEKILQIIQSLTFAIPMLVNSIGGMIFAFKGIGSLLKGIGAAQYLVNNAKSLGIALTEDMTEAQIKEAAINHILNQEGKEEALRRTAINLLKATGKKYTEDDIKAKIRELALEEALNGAKTGELIRDGLLIGLQKIKNVLTAKHITLLGIEHTLLLPVWAILLIIAGLAIGAAVAISAMVKEHEKENVAMKEAQEQAQKLSEKYAELKEAAKALKDEISNYDEAVDALANLTKGTDEYREALEAANEKARELIESQGLWDDWEYKGGLILIDEQALEDAQDKAYKAANKAKANASTAQIFASNMALTAQAKYRTSTSVSNDQELEIAKAIANIDEAKSKSNIDLATEVEAATGIGASLIEGMLNDNEMNKAIWELVDATKEATSSNEYWAKQLVTSFAEDKYRDELEQTYKDADGKTDQLKVDSVLNALGGFDKQLTEDVNKEYKQYEEDITDINRTGSLTEYLDKLGLGSRYNVGNDKELALTYAKMINPELEGQSLSYEKGNGVGTVKDATGKEIFTDLDDAMMRREVAKMATQEYIKNNTTLNLDDVKEVLKTMEQNSKAMDEKYGVDFVQAVLDSMAAGDFTEDKLKESGLNLSGLFSELSSAEAQNIKNLSDTELMQLFGLTPQDLSKLGLKTAKDFGDSVRKGMEEYSNDEYVKALEIQHKKTAEALDTLYKGDTLDEEKITELEQKYEGLKEIRDKDSQLYLEALEAIVEKEEERLTLEKAAAQEETYKKAAKDIDKALDSLKDYNNNISTGFTDPNTGAWVDYADVAIENVQKVSDSLEAMFDAENEMQKQVTDNILSDVDQIINEAKGAQVAFAAIGDGFKVAAGDSEELLKVFPELAESATVLADGTIQLNQQVAEKVLGVQGELIAGDKKKTAENIKNRIVELDAQIAADEAMLKSVTDGHMEEAELKDILKSREIDSTVSAANTTIQSSATMAKATVDNWSSMEQAALAYARTVKELPKKIKNGDFTGYIEDNIVINDVVVETDTSGMTDVESEYEKLRQKTANLLAQSIDAKKEQRAQLVQAYAQMNYETTTALKKAAEEANKDIVDLLNEEIDIYHDINVVIEKLTNTLNKLSEAQERAVGGDYINLLNEELAVLEAQKKAYEEKKTIAQGDAAARRALLASQGVTFNEQGDITNYEAILKAYQDRVNAIITEINNTQDEEKREVLESMMDREQETFEKLKEDIEKYEELMYTEIPGLDESIREVINQRIEKEVEKFKFDIELSVDLTEAKKEWTEFMNEVLYNEEDYLVHATTAMNNLKDIFNEEGGGYLQDTLDKMIQTQEEIKEMQNGGFSDIYGDNLALAQETFESLKETSINYAESIQEYIEIIEEAITGAVEKIDSLHEQIMDNYERTLQLIEHKISVSELLQGDNFDTSQYLAEKLDVYVAQIESARTAIEDIENQYDLNKLKTTDFKAYAEQLSKIADQQDTMFDSIEEALETINSLLEKSLENNLNQLQENLIGGTWSDLSDRWERDQELADIYLSTINEEYEIQKLINKINEDLLSTQYDALDAQKKINDFKETELAILLEKDKLTKAEVDRANQLYELTLLQIALEEARNNKTSMKLTRDSQGSYVYQYQADEDNIAKAQNDLSAKQNEIYNQSVENAISAIENFNSSGQGLQDRLGELFEDERFQEYLGLSTSAEGRGSDRFKELEQWMYDSYSKIASDANFEMSSYQQNALDSIKYLLKDGGLLDNYNNFDINNLTDAQRQLLLEEGINTQALNALSSFSQDSLNKELENFDGTVQGLVKTYGEQVQRIMDASGNTNTTELYETIDLIKINTDIMNKQLDEQLVEARKELNHLTEVLYPKVETIQKQFMDIFKEGDGTYWKSMDEYIKTLENNLTSVKDALNAPSNSVVSAVKEVKQAVGNIKIGNIQGDMEKALAKYFDAKADHEAYVPEGLTGTVATFTSQQDLRKRSIVSYMGDSDYFVSSDNRNGTYNLTHLFDSGKNRANVSGDLISNTGNYLTNYNNGNSLKAVYEDKNNSGYLTVKNERPYQLIASTSDGQKLISYNGVKAWATPTQLKNLKDAKITQKNRVEHGTGKGSESWQIIGVNANGTYQLKNLLTGNFKDNVNHEDIKYIDQWNFDLAGKKLWSTANAHNPTYYGKIIALAESSDKVLVENDGILKWISKIYKENNSSAYLKAYDSNIDKYNISSSGGISLASYNTGGYTGTWFNGSKDGRLAWLHQKELVLNEADTPKILDAVKLVREISAGSIIADFESQMKNTLSSLENQLIGTYANIEGMAAAAKQSTDQMLEQAVHIDASFPGVKDAREIEEALNNLVNVASQYAYEDNK